MLMLRCGTLSVKQVALGNNYSTAREGEGEMWRCVEEKGAGHERFILRELAESGNSLLTAGAQLCVHPPYGEGKFLQNSLKGAHEGGP